MYFHAGIQSSVLAGQRSVARVCENSIWQGVTIPFISTTYLLGDDEPTMVFRQEVYARGMKGSTYVSRFNARAAYKNAGVVTCAQDIFYL